MTAFWAIVERDVRIAMRVGGGAFLALVFFALVALVVPIGLGPDLPLLSRIAPSMAWVGAVLATQVTLDRLFQADHEDGALDSLISADLPLELAVLAKCLAHWLTSGLPIVFAVPVFGLLFTLEAGLTVPLMLALALGTPALSLLGAIGAALTVAMRRGGVLISLLVMPLYIPIMIFGVGAVGEQGESGLMSGPSILVLMALTLFSAVLAAWAGAAALRLNSD